MGKVRAKADVAGKTRNWEMGVRVSEAGGIQASTFLPPLHPFPPVTEDTNLEPSQKQRLNKGEKK